MSTNLVYSVPVLGPAPAVAGTGVSFLAALLIPLAIGAIAAAVYYFYFRGKNGKGSNVTSGTGSEGSGGSASGHQDTGSGSGTSGKGGQDSGQGSGQGSSSGSGSTSGGGKESGQDSGQGSGQGSSSGSGSTSGGGKESGEDSGQGSGQGSSSGSGNTSGEDQQSGQSPSQDSRPTAVTDPDDGHADDYKYTVPVTIRGNVTNWSLADGDPSGYTVDKIPPELNAVGYAYFGVNDEGKLAYTSYSVDRVQIPKFITTCKNNNARPIMVVGGWVASGTKTPTSPVSTQWDTDTNEVPNKSYHDLNREIMKNPQTFVDSLVQAMNTHGFTGVDIDIESPVCPQNVCDDSLMDEKDMFTNLLKEIKKGLPTGAKLYVSISSDADIIAKAYDTQALFSVADEINVKTYDYFVPSTSGTKTGHTAPKVAFQNAAANHNIKDTITYLASVPGYDANKVTIGVSTTCRSWKISADDYQAVANNTKDFSNLQSTGPGSAGPITQMDGALATYELCSTYGSNLDATTYVEGDGTWVPVADDQIVAAVSYYDLRAVRSLMEQLQIKGVHIDSVVNDDHRNSCNLGTSFVSKYLASQTIPKVAMKRPAETVVMSAEETHTPRKQRSLMAAMKKRSGSAARR